MPRFPKREAHIIALTDSMIAGYTANPGDFPNAYVAGLRAERAQYQTGKDAQTRIPHHRPQRRRQHGGGGVVNGRYRRRDALRLKAMNSFEALR